MRIITFQPAGMCRVGLGPKTKQVTEREQMKFSEKFKGNFLKAADLNEQAHRATITSVKCEKMGDGDEKVVLYFEEVEQGLVLNKTNGSVLAGAFGDEMNAWSGKTIVLRPEETDFQGKRVPCIRVALPKKPALEPAPAPVTAEEPPF